MLDRFKEFIGIDDNYDDYDDDQMYYDEEETDEDKSERKTYSNLIDDDKTPSYSSNTFSSNSYSKNDDYTYKGSYTSSKDDNIVSMNSNNFSRSSSNMRISIQEPLDYDNDAPVVIEEILKNRVVVLNLEMVDNDLRMRIFDFVSGAVYALKGNMKKVTKGIFVITPNGVEIDSFVADQISEGNYNQL
ncbi:cell division protein SepF [uncultured Anaerococcus sp.]|uniref:cell division protein SepF n=1 Tax=uncultured Anaerococcus sp. TaxID=293428 RepID=UPI0025FDEED8|nr:cell division protein SepF [uncultured Anaerococcus sp.]